MKWFRAIQRNWEALKVRMERIYLADFWVAKYSNNTDDRIGIAAVFGKDLDEASIDADYHLSRTVKDIFKLKDRNFTLYIEIFKPTFFQRLFTTTQDLNFRRVA